ncbi:hypothetical protein K7432_006370 [Basidiobolus ranarum]|uniref:LAA1-like C-terminal TPR repeats domain-containing protein n=1 Tax=Basidiobolus ranarum TaxID=34480 RepID=A0ABR2WV85_9FUNG
MTGVNPEEIATAVEKSQDSNTFKFDESTLVAAASSVEKQELILLQWLTTLEKELQNISEASLKGIQDDLVKQLMRFFTYPSPKLKRPHRQVLSRCLVTIYLKGDTLHLIDTLNILNGLTISGKSGVDRLTRIASIYCTGILFESCGFKIGSYFVDTTTGLLKIIKSASEQYAGSIKVEAIRAIAKVIHGSGKNAPDQSLKEIVKYMKSGLCDRSFAHRIACAQCLREVASQTTYLIPSIANDLDILLLQIFKAFESSNYDVRREIASLAAVITATTQSPVMSTASTKSGIRMAKSVSFPTQSNSPTFEAGSRRGENGVFSIEETLSALSSCFSKIVTRESRVGIIETYSELFLSLGPNFIEVNYAAISRHILVELVGKNLTGTKLDILCVQEWCSFLLRDIIGKRLLSEQGQVLAIRELMGTWIKPWESNNPSKYILRCVLNEVNGLILDLGGVASSVQESLIDPLVTLLGHTSHTVQVALASCFRSLCYSLPVHLPKLLSKILKLLQRTLPTNVSVQNSSMGVFKKCLGLTQILCALITLIPEKQLYISHELYGGVFSVAVQLLKNATSSETQHMWISSVEYRVGWSLIGSLMCIGPQFSRLHMSQLMNLWRSSFPKIVAKDSNRGPADWLYMLQTREVALSALYSFLIQNGKDLVTTDAAKRITQFLDNTLLFLSLIPPNIIASSPNSSRLFPCTLNLTECETLVRKRLFECYAALKPVIAYEASFSSLLKNAIDLITDPEVVPDRDNTTSIMGNSGSNIFPGYSCGMTSSFLTKSWDQILEPSGPFDITKEWRANVIDFREIDQEFVQPMVGAPEYDPSKLYIAYYNSTLAQSCSRFPKPMPSIIGVTDAAINLITIIFPYLSSSVQEFTLEQLWKSLKNSKLEKSSNRKVAVQVNIIVVLLRCMEKLEKLASKRTDGITIPTAQGRTTALAKEILQSFLSNSDPYIRCASGQALGLLAQIVGNPFITSQIQYLVDVIVNDRDPNVRSGCVIALSCIYNRVGGIAANVHLKIVVGILHSLSSDSHPIVHSWALKALSLTIDSAGSMFAPYVNGTIGIVAKVFMSEGHEPGYHPHINPPFGMAQEVVYQTLGHLLYVLVGTLGPELQAATKVREICLCLIEELKNNDESLVVVEYIKCVQHLLMFAPNSVDISTLVPFLQNQLHSFNFRLKSAAVTCLYQLVQRNVKDVLKNSKPGLREQLFFLLDDGLEMEDAKRVIKSHLSQTVTEESLKWLDICKRILSKSSSDSNLVENKGADMEEYGDDSAAFTAADVPTTSSGQVSAEDFSKLPSRWRAQLFALDCLRVIVNSLAKGDEKAHFDMVYAKEKFPSNTGYLVYRLPELIKMSFVAATSSIIQIRLDGLSLLRDLIKHFATSSDPDFEEAMILEQYQAQITSALTPAFSSESAPEVMASAIQVCGDFIANHIVREIGTLGRMVKLLTTTLNESSEENINNESPDGKILVKITTLKIWAELFVLSQTEEYLLEIVEPKLEVLCELWLTFVQDYAKVRLGSTGVTGSNGLSADALASGLESIYGSSVIEVILPYYEKAWIPIMNAISVLIDSDNHCMHNMLRESTKNEEIYETPSRFFFILLGLCIEALAEPAKTHSYSKSLNAILVLVKALRSILKPLVAGRQCLEQALYMEIMCVLEKLMAQESIMVQVAIADVFKTLAIEYSTDYLFSGMSTVSGDNYEDLFMTTKAYPCTKILILGLSRSIPELSSEPSTTALPTNSQGAVLVLAVLDALSNIIMISPDPISIDLFATFLHVSTSAIRTLMFSKEEVSKFMLIHKNIFIAVESGRISQEREAISSTILQALNTVISSVGVERLNSQNYNESEANTINNMLMFIVLLLTTCPSYCDSSLSPKLTNIFIAYLFAPHTQITRSALQYAKAFLYQNNKSDTGSKQISSSVLQNLIPEIIKFLYQVKSSDSEFSSNAINQGTVEEAADFLVAFGASTKHEKRSTIFTLVICTLVNLLDSVDGHHEPSELHQIVIAKMVTLATECSQDFKTVLNNLEPDMRTKLEHAIRQSVRTSSRAHTDGNQEKTAPKIQLKDSFANF